MQMNLEVKNLQKELLWQGVATSHNGSILFGYQNPKTKKWHRVEKLESDYTWTQTKTPQVIIRVGYERVASQKPHILIIKTKNNYVELPHWTDGSGERPIRNLSNLTTAQRLRNGE